VSSFLWSLHFIFALEEYDHGQRRLFFPDKILGRLPARPIDCVGYTVTDEALADYGTGIRQGLIRRHLRGPGLELMRRLRGAYGYCAFSAWGGIFHRRHILAISMGAKRTGLVYIYDGPDLYGIGILQAD